MAVLEVFKGDALLRSKSVSDEKARSGIVVRLNEQTELRIALGESKTAAGFTVALRADADRSNTAAGPTAPTAATAERHGPHSAPTVRPIAGQTAETASLSAPPASTAETPPDLQDYQILGPLGRGGMGVVWRAKQISTSRPVALKMLGPRFVASDRGKARFEREVRLAASLEHPGIARIYDSGIHRGAYFYAMELVDGELLDVFVRHRMLDHRAIAALMAEIARAVGFAHAKGVIHRDLKPQNILVRPDGSPVVLDFGLARSTDPQAGTLAISVEGDAAGTPAYMSPEQAAGRSTDIDRQSDVYSLGVTLYKLLTGRLPHDMSGPTHEVMRRLTEEDIRPPHLFADLDKDLEAVLLRACAHSRHDRYSSATQLAEDLDRFIRGEPVEAKRYSATAMIRRSARRNRSKIFAASAVAAVVLVSLGVVVFVVRDTQRARQRALDAVVQATAEKAELENKLQSLLSEAASLRTLLASASKPSGSASSEELAKARTRLAELENLIAGMSSKIHDLQAMLPKATQITPARPSAVVSADQPTTPEPIASASASRIRPQDNAAEIYRSFPDRIGRAALTAIDQQGANAPELIRHAADIQFLIDATKRPHADFEIDWTPGWKTVLPHLGSLRQLARLLNAESERRLNSGNRAGAAECQVAILRLAVHTRESARSLIESLVAVAIAKLSTDFLTAHQEVATDPGARDLRAALVAVQDQIVRTMPQIHASDIQISAYSLRRNLFTPDLLRPPAKDWSKASQAERDKAAARLDAWAKDVANAGDRPDGDRALQAIAEEAKNDGLDTLVFLPNPDKSKSAAMRLDQSIRTIIAAMR